MRGLPTRGSGIATSLLSPAMIHIGQRAAFGQERSPEIVSDSGHSRKATTIVGGRGSEEKHRATGTGLRGVMPLGRFPANSRSKEAPSASPSSDPPAPP